jgi:anti-anti-sigma regulatory factor
MRGVPSVDVSAVQILLSFCEARQKTGQKAAFACLSADVKTMLDRGGVTELVGDAAYFPTAKDAIVTYSRTA